MTDTQDGCPILLKYASRRREWEAAADQALRDFYKEQEIGRKFYEKLEWTTDEISKLKNKN